LPGTNLTRQEAADRAALLRVESYQVTLDLTTDEETFRSSSTIRFSCNRPGAATFVDLIAPAVREIRLNGLALDPVQVVSSGRIQLDDLAADNELVVVADCAFMHTGEGLHRFVDPVDKEIYLYTQFEVADARRVFACFDQPDLKATFAFTVTAPARWEMVSVSPTPAPEPQPAGAATWRFEPTPRISTYVTAIVAGPYHAARGELTSRDGRTIPLGVFCRASLATYLDADALLEITRAGFAHYERVFDQSYPFSKYDQLFVPEFNAGAMENAGAVTITEQYVFRSKVPEATVERRALTVLHELAHMWFGDLVTMRWWDDLWLNESFAEYASTRCQAEGTRWHNAWTTFSSAEKAWAYRQDQLASTHPVVADIRDLEDVEVNFDGITYAKGASVLKQLVHWVGQDAFDEGLRQYFRRHAWGNTTLDDLLAELEATSGRDLGAWAAQWLGTAGVAVLRPTAVRDGDRLVSIAILQEPPPDHPHLRPHRLAVGCYDVVDGRLRRTARAELDVDGASTPVSDLAGRPSPALLLVNDDDLTYAKIRLDRASLATAMQHLSDFEESLPATLIWSAAWDMTRDAELPARQFVDLVLGNVSGVRNASVAMTLLRQVAAALEMYVAPEDREAALASAAGRLLDLLHSAEPGSDLQLLAARSFAAHAVDDQLEVLRGLLDGGQVIDGLTVDTEMRWTLLSALAASGRAGEQQIAAEMDRDDTATGRLHAAAARASLPTGEAKAAAWKSVVEDGELPNAVQAAVIGGFTRTRDRSVLAPYVEPYFEALTRVWSERTSEMATQIAVGLFPTTQPGEQVLARTDRWLAETQVEPALHRLVLEGRDGVARALRAQACDRASRSDRR
jgi:aminopeptidase N